MSDPTIGRFIGEVKSELTTSAKDAMLFPKSEPFDHGVQVGRYQGLQLALDILETMLRDNLEAENNR